MELVTSLVAQMVKRLHKMWETWVQSLDGRAWKATVHGVAKSWARLKDFTFQGWSKGCAM